MSRDDQRGPAGPGGITRRRFLIYTGATGTAVLLRDALVTEALAQAGQSLPFTNATLTLVGRRREDFLSLVFEFHNLKLDNSKPKRLVKVTSNQPAYMVVGLPPQHLADEVKSATDLANPDPSDAPGELRSRLAGRSRLAFEVPGTELPLSLELDELLDWVNLPQHVTRLARPIPPPPPGQLSAPAANETAIELPWFLVLSSRPDAGWAHARVPVTRAGRTELWHTRLGTRVPLLIDQEGHVVPPHVDEFDDGKRTVQAVWARDANFPAPTPETGPLLSLSAQHRREIVHLSSIVPDRRPVQVNRLMLSSLGGWLDSRGVWDPAEDSGFSVEEWRHRATTGRDSYVRVVTRGFLMPLGHKAATIEITERQFHQVGSNPSAAYLVKRTFVVVREPFKEYGQAKALHQPKDGRGFPFRSVRITTLTTPNLDLETSNASVFLPKAEDDGRDILFDCIGVDWDGQPTEFQARLMFVDHGAASTSPPVQLAAQFNSLGKDLRSQSVDGQKVAFAPSKQGGDTSFPVEEFVMRAQELVAATQAELEQKRNELREAGLPPFYPLLEEAKARLSAVGETAGGLLDLVGVKLDKSFIDFGFPDMELPDIPNPADLLEKHAGELFLELVGDLPDLGFGSSDVAGGLATPNLSIAALSRALGPVGGVLDDLRAGKFDPKTFFDTGAKLLGSLRLADIIKAIEGPHGLGEFGPKLQNTIIPKPPAIPEKVVTRLDWAPQLQDLDPLQIFESTEGESGLTLKAEITTHLQQPDLSTFSVEGLLRNVKLHLIGKGSAFLIIEVKQVKFTAGKDKPPDLDPQLGEITFDGPLAFVEEMRNFLSSLGKGYGIEVQPYGIEANLSLPLPALSVGVFSLQNISIGLGATIPFTGDPARFRFAFCSRENPFILTVAMFGGGGFFAIECGTDKSIMLELSLEFGAAVAFDIGVASGGVEVMAGIYIKVENDDALLSGFLRMAGELDILGLIRISCEIYLGFEYYAKEDKCIGIAKFYLEVEIFGFITIPVKAQVRRAFGGEKDPTFAQLMSPDDWTEYCDAYAPLVTA